METRCTLVCIVALTMLGACGDKATVLDDKDQSSDIASATDTAPSVDIQSVDSDGSVCRPTSRWSKGIKVFREVTSEWNLI